MSRFVVLALLAVHAGPAPPPPDLAALARSGTMPAFPQVVDARFSAVGRQRFDAFAAWAKELDPAERARWLAADGSGPDGTPRWRATVECAVLDSRGLARAMVAALRAAPDRATALARWQEVERAYAAGARLEERLAAKARREAVRRPTAIGRELAIRVAADQAWRQVQSDRPHVDDMAEAIAYRTGSRVCHIDADDTRWLETVLARDGWPLVSRDGKAAADDAWLLAQHADNDRAFQERVLAVMRPLVARGEADGKNYALLYDRVATGAGRPQRYATQFTRSDDGCTMAMATEDPAGIDARRGAVGLRPIRAYAQGLAKAYHTKPCANIFPEMPAKNR